MAKLARRATLVACCGVFLFSCKSDRPPAATRGELQTIGQSWDLCTWLGPRTGRPGIFGSDLGFAVPLPSQSGVPDQLQLLFGDTWAKASDACQYPVLKNDDLAARIPAAKPASLTPAQPTAASEACGSLQYTLENSGDATSWRRIRLFPDAGPRSDDRVLDTGMLRTPLTAWSDGAHTFAIFVRAEYARCQTSAACPAAMICSQDPAYSGRPIGGCQPQLVLTSDTPPLFCRADADCSAPSTCMALERGVCLATEPFTVQRAGQTLSPRWYADDPRLATANILQIATAFGPTGPKISRPAFAS